MVVEQITSVLAGLAVSVLGGALSAYMGWNASMEPFNPRKFINGIITGVIGGLGVLMVNIVILKGISDEVELIGALITILLGVVGVDRLRTDLSKTISKRNAEKELT